MATYEDYSGTFFSCQALRYYHDLRDCEIVIIDNDPKGNHGKSVASFAKKVSLDSCPVRYLPFTENTGTTQTRERIFAEAKGEAVLVMDSHVLLEPGAIARLKEWYSDPSRVDLYTGPLMMDNLKSLCTHFEPEWRGEMWGIWATAWIDPKGNYVVGQENGDKKLELKFLNSEGPWTFTGIDWAGHEKTLIAQGYKLAGWDNNGPEFEIPAQGLGLFSSRKDSWLGFNPNFRSFGGEECYIHEKYRQAGRKTLCLPWLKWNHRFDRPDGVPYPISKEGKARNYVLGLTELGLDLEPARKHFVEEAGMPQRVWDSIVADPINFQAANTNVRAEQPINAEAKATSNNNLPLPVGVSSLTGIANWIEQNAKRDLDQHSGKLQEFAKKCLHITEMTKRRESTAFLLAGLSERNCDKTGCDKVSCGGRGCKVGTMVSFQEEKDTLLEQLHVAVSSGCRMPISFTSTITSLHDLPVMQDETDMLFLDTRHTYDRLFKELETYGPKVRKYIAIHDTGLYSVKGEDGGKGLGHATRDFLKAYPEWFVVFATPTQYGLTVLSRIPEERPAKEIRTWAKECGVGTNLSETLKKLGFEQTEGCSCRTLKMLYDNNGTAWCREQVERIIDDLYKQAESRKKTHLFFRPVVKLMVMRAIWQAEKDVKAGKCPE
jgi:glycosyltransferase involved in cell wall biosynthesis